MISERLEQPQGGFKRDDRGLERPRGHMGAADGAERARGPRAIAEGLEDHQGLLAGRERLRVIAERCEDLGAFHHGSGRARAVPQRLVLRKPPLDHGEGALEVAGSREQIPESHEDRRNPHAIAARLQTRDFALHHHPFGWSAGRRSDAGGRRVGHAAGSLAGSATTDTYERHGHHGGGAAHSGSPHKTQAAQ